MIELFSVVLHIVEIFQNLNKQKTLEAKIDDMKTALEFMDKIYYILSSAKKVHDIFENFGTVIDIKEITDVIKNGNTSEKEKLDRLNTLKEYIRTYVVDIEVPDIEIMHNVTNQSELTNGVKECIRNIMLAFPSYKKHIKYIKKNIRNFNQLHNKRNLGDDLIATITSIKHNYKEIQWNADKLILNIVPIIDYIHHELKMGVNKLK